MDAGAVLVTSCLYGKDSMIHYIDPIWPRESSAPRCCNQLLQLGLDEYCEKFQCEYPFEF